MIRAISSILLFAVAASGQETLYNGIRLPGKWPPRDVALSNEPAPLPPYLLNPPEVIPIDVGRQLFVDDFLIEQTSLRRTFHHAEYYSGNPVLKADKPWEFSGGAGRAMPFSDGAFYDPADGLFKLWYMGYNATLFANSRDGVHWEKPALDVKPGTNIVHMGKRDSSTVWLDQDEKDPRRRYKLLYSGGHMQPVFLHVSADGIHWGEPVAKSIPAGDRTTFFKNPFRDVWIFSLRDHDWVPGQPANREYVGRLRRYWERSEFEKGAVWKKEEPPLWTMADRLDPRRIDLNVQPQLYNLDCVAYESLILGLFDIWVGQTTNRPKPNYLTVGFTRDGFHWNRPTHEPFISLSERKGDWNWGNVQSAGGCCLVVDDKLYFYVSGRAGVDRSAGSGVCTTGLATLRRDGFASMDASKEEGTLTTRPVTFRGKYLFINADADQGDLRVEVLHKDGKVVKPFTRGKCTPASTDKTLQAVKWGRKADLSGLAGQPVKFRFHLKNARLYSFWVSPEPSGASHGYVAAGGPGFTGPTDTIGER